MNLLVSILSADVSKQPQFALRDITFQLTKGEILVLVGESGVGKSSLLNVIAGFIPLQKGEIRLGETVLSSAQETVKPSQRSVAYIFQKENLLPHLSLYKNLILGLPKHTVAEKRAEIERLMKRLGISHLRDKYPDNVSGGQQQRIALGRALLHDKQLFLFDEAFTGLDKEKTYELAQEIRAFIQEYGRMAIFVTHQIEEAFLVADRVGIVRNGRLMQLDTPEDIYHSPFSPEVAQFIGPVNYLTGTQTGDTIQTDFGTINATSIETTKEQKSVMVLTRPDDYLLNKEKTGAFQITHIHFLGMQKIVSAKNGRNMISVLVEHEKQIHEGDRVEVFLKNSHPYLIFPAAEPH
jgi:iron(III) transport system ATP-binding protein